MTAQLDRIEDYAKKQHALLMAMAEVVMLDTRYSSRVAEPSYRDLRKAITNGKWMPAGHSGLSAERREEAINAAVAGMQKYGLAGTLGSTLWAQSWLMDHDLTAEEVLEAYHKAEKI